MNVEFVVRTKTMNYFKKYSIVIVGIVSLFVAFVFYSSQMSHRKELTILEKITYTFFSPIEISIQLTKSAITNLFESYINLFDAKKESQKLREENMKLHMEIQILSQLQEKNQKLRKLLHFVENTKTHFMRCEVISGYPSSIYKSLRVYKGRKDGVEVGMGVVSDIGAVGIVINVTPYFSDIILFNDPNTNLDVVISRNRTRGIIGSIGGDIMRFKHLWRGSRIVIGDEVVTSGLTGPLPAGIPVGKVSNISLSTDGFSELIDVVPFVNFGNLSTVLILKRDNKDLIKNDNKDPGGFKWMEKVLEFNKIER